MLFYRLSHQWLCQLSKKIRKRVLADIFLNVCPLIAVAGNVKVEPVNLLTTSVGWLYLPQLTALSRVVIIA